MSPYLAAVLGAVAGLIVGLAGAFWCIGMIEDWPTDADDFGDLSP